jgi:hypothetical protein
LAHSLSQKAQLIKPQRAPGNILGLQMKVGIEEGKIGKNEKEQWKDGRLEEWNDGRTRDWKNGKLE